MNSHHTLSLRHGVAAAFALATVVTVCSVPASATEPSGDVPAFCQAAIDFENATIADFNGDPSLLEPALEAVLAATPEGLEEAVNIATDPDAGDAFDAAYAEVIDYVKANCSFNELAITGSEYAFGGLPETVPAGPAVITFENTGEEFHEVLLQRVNDDVTETLDELLTLPEEEVMGRMSMVGFSFAAPGTTGFALADLQQGRYIAVCTIPVGSTPDNWPPSTDAMAEPHLAHGMAQEFEVVDADSSPETSGS